MPLTRNGTLDIFLTRYFEETQKVLSEHIDFPLFKRIAFASGVPYLLVDLFANLTGQREKVKEAMKLLNDRVEPYRVPKRKEESPVLRTPFWRAGQLPPRMPKQPPNFIPPLKDYPDEIETDESDPEEDWYS